MNVSQSTEAHANVALPPSWGGDGGGRQYREFARAVMPPLPLPSPPLEGEGDRALLTFIANQVKVSPDIEARTAGLTYFFATML